MDHSFLAFLGISILVIVTPGPDTALTIRNTIMGGRRGGVFTAFGIVAGQTIWVLAASAGIVALLVASEKLFAAVRLAGAAYLIYLGARSLYDAMRSGRWSESATAVPAQRLAPSEAFSQGLASDLSNPKMAAFFSSLLPQFAVTGDGAFAHMLGLGAVFCAMALAWLTLYAFAVARAGDLLRRRNVRRTLEGLMGAALVALGLRIAAEHR